MTWVISNALLLQVRGYIVVVQQNEIIIKEKEKQLIEKKLYKKGQVFNLWLG